MSIIEKTQQKSKYGIFFVMIKILCLVIPPYGRVNYGRPSVTDYRQAECLDDRQTNWLACEQLGPLDCAAMRWSKGVESRSKGFAPTLPQLDIYSNKDLLLHYITPYD